MTLTVCNCFRALRRTCLRWGISKTANVYFKKRDTKHGRCVVVSVLSYIPCASPTHSRVCALLPVLVRNAPLKPILRIATNYEFIRQAHITVALCDSNFATNTQTLTLTQHKQPEASMSHREKGRRQVLSALARAASNASNASKSWIAYKHWVRMRRLRTLLLPLLGLLTLPLPILLPIPLSLPGLKIGAIVMVGLGLVTPKALRLLSQVSRRCY